MSNNKKHIVFITPGFATSEEDRNTISALQIYCKKLQEREDIKLSIITLHYPHTKIPYLWHNCNVYPLGYNNRKISRIFSSRKVLQKLSFINDLDPIDFLHSFWLGECAYWGHRYSKKQNIPHLTTLMGQDAKKGNKYAKIIPHKKMNIVTLSKFQQNLFLKNYKMSSRLIPWGVDRNLIASKAIKTIDIIGIGSLIHLKNYSEFINTIYLLKKEFPTINATLVGDGVLKPQLLKQISELGLTETITLSGQQSYDNTQQLLARSKILLHPSDYESFGMVFAEAQAHQVKIVSKKVGLAEPSHYWKIGNTPEEFTKKCVELLHQETMLFVNYPNVETTVDEYIKIYSQE